MADKRITDLSAATALTGGEVVELSQLSTTVKITATTISAVASDNSYNDSADGFVTAGFATNDRVQVAGFTGNVANNIFVGTITALTAGKMTIGGTDGDVIVDDAAGESVTISKWTSKRTTAQDIADLTPTGGGGGSLPPGGTTGQVLTKQSATDGDADWETPSGGGGGGSYSPAWPLAFTPPAASSFTSLVSSDATNVALTDDSDLGLAIDGGPPNNGSGVLRAGFQPSLTDKTLDWTAVAKFEMPEPNGNYWAVGFLLRDTVSGRYIRVSFSSDYGFYVVYDTGINVNDSVPYGWNSGNGKLPGIKWIRIRHTGGNLYFDVSPDGKRWGNQYSTSATAWLTNRANQIGFYVGSAGKEKPQMFASIPYWSLTGAAV